MALFCEHFQVWDASWELLRPRPILQLEPKKEQKQTEANSEKLQKKMVSLVVIITQSSSPWVNPCILTLMMLIDNVRNFNCFLTHFLVIKSPEWERSLIENPETQHPDNGALNLHLCIV